MHRLTLVINEHNIVYIRTVEVYLVIVLLRVVTRYEALVLHRIALHHTCSNRLLYLCVEFFKRTYALLSAILVAPDRQRCTPEA